ncbi:ribosomal L31-like protein [Fluviicoccus keumensis]|uniref:Ribosomal L31-like protein n=1 Tax=Fluviicoccus keumensis TaxID=1435465 RepID=A0A4Q7ZB84_9GAMM|nr:50S ribosomal protein L31 [Fluviicoccus keumensis]RZU47414.1 ribosomal L31-like protein [Fluviicoccus keumensis]
MSDRIIQGSGFVAGTLVHTDKGLVPIELLRDGDMVLSKPENGTCQPDYKRVLNKCCYKDKAVKALSVYGKTKKKFEVYVVSGSHPFWVKNNTCGDAGWMSADKLQMNYQLELVNSDEKCIVFYTNPLYRTDDENSAWFEVNYSESIGITIDLSDNHVFYHEEAFSEGPHDNFYVDGLGNDRYDLFKATLYNIEVEGHHDYYIGELGVLVHGIDCNNNDKRRIG